MKTALTDEQVADAMRARLGPISRWERLPGGEMSQAFAFRAVGRDLVVRVGPRREGFDKDAWAATRFRDTVVPVPEVLQVGELRPGVFCCVSERLGGVHLTDCEEAEQRRTAPAVGAVIDAIAAVDLSGSTGFGSFDPETEQGPHPTWAAHLRSLLPDRWDLDDPADVALAEDLASIADDIAVSLPEVRRLVHGDLNPGNFTVAEGAVVGVFDWEAAVIGDPLWEIARYLLWAPVMPSTRIQTEYDLKRLSAEPNLIERLRCLVIVNGLWAVDFYRKSGQTPATELMLNRLHGFRDDPLPLDTGFDAYWMRLLPPGARRA